VLKGDLSLYADDQKIATISGDRKFCDVFRGDILGEMSLIDVEPASATVRAVTQVGIWSIDRVNFAAVLRKDLTTYIVVITNIARILSRRLRDAGKIHL
jgi:CRP-like cAMP-binding protein